MNAQRLGWFANQRIVGGLLLFVVMLPILASGCGGDAEPPRYAVTLAMDVAEDITLRINSQVCSLEPIRLSRNTMVVVDGTCVWLKPIAQTKELSKSSNFPTTPEQFRLKTLFRAKPNSDARSSANNRCCAKLRRH